MLLPSAVWFWAWLSARAGEPPSPAGKEISQQYIGEGGSFVPPSGEASDYLENGAREHTGQGTFGPVLPPPPRNKEYGSAVPSPLPYGSASQPHGRKGSEPATASGPSVPYLPPLGAPERRRYSLWEGLSAPLELPAEKAGGVPSDQASAMVRQDYESHILRSGAGEPAALPPRESSPKPSGGEVFVALELRGSQAETGYRDAVADLSRVAQFREDLRFRSRSGDASGRLSLWGWMPARKLGEALKISNVARVEVQRPAPAFRSGEGSRTELVIGIRVSDPASLEKKFSRVISELGASADFRWKRTVGYQKVPGSADLALVVIGEVPMRQIWRVMAHSDILKVMPLPSPPETSAPRAPDKAPGRVASFLSYAAGRNPMLVFFTLLILIPLCVRLGFRLIWAFIPYR